MRFLRRATSFLNNFSSSNSSNEGFVNKVGSLMSTISFLHIGIVAAPLMIIIIVFLTLFSLFGYKMSLFQMVDSSTSSRSSVAIDLNYDFEEYVSLSDAAYESGNIPSVDLADSDYNNVASFNQHIKDSVCNAGFGTREAVVTAGVSLIGDYIKGTGKRIRYDQGGRQSSDVEGIVNEDFYLDCSGFSWWALYNGGFNLPSWPQTQSIYDWALSYGGTINNDITQGQPGDYLDVPDSHIVLIIGKYDDGYYVAEEAGWGTGGIIKKRSFANVSSYTLLDMSKFYNDSSNVRPSTC